MIILSTEEYEKAVSHNTKVLEAIAIRKLMETDSWDLLINKILERQNKIRFQDLLGVKKESVEEVQGRILGMEDILFLFNEIKNLSDKPLIDLETGRPEERRKRDNEKAS